jgi:outer membrane autotransporter protein
MRNVQISTRNSTLRGSTALVAIPILSVLALMLDPRGARAVDGIWTGAATNDWTVGANWTSNPLVPDNTATFTNNGAPTTVTFGNNASINTIQFDAGAPAYTFVNNIAILNISGTGIVNNSANAPTFINAAVLNFNNSSTAGNAVIVNNNSLNFNDSSTAGNAVITNNTLMNFSEASTAGNAVITNNGVIGFVNSSAAGNAAITNNNVLAFFNTSTAGSATITNNANLDFNNSSTAGGAAIVNNGILDFNNASAAGSATITNNQILRFFTTSTAGSAIITNNNLLGFFDTSTAANATITTNNGGTTLFSDNSTGGLARLVTNSGGSVDMSGLASAGTAVGSIEGAGNYFLGSKTFTVGGNNLSTEVSGAIQDGGTSGGIGGALMKVGTGTLTLSGASTFTGPTNVNAGILNVSGSLVSTVLVNSGGTLMGIGSIGGLNVANGGTVAPGNSIGTINVTGNVGFAPGSIYQVEANAAGQSDRIAANGSATLTGGTVQVVAAPGVYGPSTVYTILTALGGVTGAFTDVSDNSIFLDSSLSYTPNAVLLTLSRIPFVSVAQTPNQAAVASALDRGGGALALAIFNQNTAAGARQAFDALSGEVHASVQTALVEDSRYVRNAVLGRLRAGSYVGDVAMASLAVGGPAVAYLAEEPSAALAYAAKGPRPAPAPFPVKAAALAAPGFGIATWAQGYGAWGRWDGDGNAAEMKRRYGGFFAGVDGGVADLWRVGIAGGYSRSDVNVDARASSADVDSYHIAGYFGARFGDWRLRGGGAYAWHDIDTFRSIVFPGFADRARADYNAGTAQVFAELGYGMRFGNVAVEPFAGLAWVGTRTGAFTEGALGAAGLTGAGDRQNVGYSTLGIRTATSIPLWSSIVLIPRVSAAWQHAFNEVTPDAGLAFLSNGAAFTIAGVPIARDSALVDAGLDFAVGRYGTFGVSYVGQIGDGVRDHAVKGKAVWQF